MKNLYNPLTVDFKVQLADENNKPHQYIIHAREIETYEDHVALHIAKTLARKMGVDNPDPNFEDAYNKYYKIITEDMDMEDI